MVRRGALKKHGLPTHQIPGYTWGLPVIVPTCPRKLFAQGPRKKYVDIVMDTLHASSSDLVTSNTLVMMKLNWIDSIPREWIEITTQRSVFGQKWQFMIYLFFAPQKR